MQIFAFPEIFQVELDAQCIAYLGGPTAFARELGLLSTLNTDSGSCATNLS